MSDPLTVSVVIPTYNRADLIGRAIRSVLGQTFQDFEIIVVDDASTDDVQAAISRFQDPRIRCIRHDANRGPGAARNTGARAGRGEYLAFLDSDDEWLPQKLELQLEVFRTSDLPRLAAVNGGTIRVDPNGELVRYSPQLRGDAFDQALSVHGMPGTGSVLMVHRRVIDGGILFDEALPAFEDYEFFLHISRDYQVDTIAAPLDRKYENFAGPHVWNSQNIIDGHLGILEKYAEDLRSRPGILSKRHLALAMTYCRVGEVKAARRHIRAAIEALPSSRWNRLWLLVSYLGRRGFLFLYPKLGADKKRYRARARVRLYWNVLRQRVGKASRPPVYRATLEQ